MCRAAALLLVAPALALAVVFTAAPPAQAHSCGGPAEFQVKRPGAISFGVPAEDFAVTEIDVTIPGEFALSGLDGPPEWKSTQEGRQLHLLGGPIAPFTCAFFTLRGMVERPGKLTFPFVIRGEGGRTSEYKGTKINDLFAGQLVFAGVSAKESDYLATGGEGGGGSTLQPAFIAAAGGLTVGGALALLARRRAAGS